jgi:hypothetical protein
VDMRFFRPTKLIEHSMRRQSKQYGYSLAGDDGTFELSSC